MRETIQPSPLSKKFVHFLRTRLGKEMLAPKISLVYKDGDLLLIRLTKRLVRIRAERDTGLALHRNQLGQQ
jgi:hypothetical protein